MSPLLAETFLYSALYVRHLVTPFEAWAIKYLVSCSGIRAGNFRMVSADCFAERQE